MIFNYFRLVWAAYLIYFGIDSLSHWKRDRWRSQLVDGVVSLALVPIVVWSFLIHNVIPISAPSLFEFDMIAIVSNVCGMGILAYTWTLNRRMWKEYSRVSTELKHLRWHDLNDAYGAATEIRKLVAQINNFESPAPEAVWTELWSRLCHQGDIYTASYAAVIAIVQLLSYGRLKSVTLSFNYFLLPASIEIARAQGRGPDVPQELEPWYRDAITQLGEFAAAYREFGDPYLRKAAEVAYLVTNGQIDEAEELSNEESPADVQPARRQRSSKWNASRKKSLGKNQSP